MSAAVVPLLIASSHGGLSMSPFASYTIAIISCSLVILLGVATIYFGGENFKKNEENKK